MQRHLLPVRDMDILRKPRARGPLEFFSTLLSLAQQSAASSISPDRLVQFTPADRMFYLGDASPKPPLERRPKQSRAVSAPLRRSFGETRPRATRILPLCPGFHSRGVC